MTTISSDLALTVTGTHRFAGTEASAHVSRDESPAMIPPLILELSATISRRAALLNASSSDPVQSSDDLAALAWIRQSLEDIEATIIGLSEANHRHSAAIKAPVDHAGGLRRLPSTPEHLASSILITA
ncbi:hypothetical protein GCM10009712_38600 [Pseudarthrobacter sulfonivorans]|uniref:hypothetical protein n=1 Tax=Pseudarthrobacter sulfonivorans TaxID=121292 RepID=UPI00168A79F7|nr:hypothetical protein [Pseudarthrobacter sulfonivorans]